MKPNKNHINTAHIILIAVGLFILAFYEPRLKCENWERFRGPTGQGISSEKDLPLHWNANSNVLWKTEIPGEAWSSPIVYNDRIFLTTATDGGVSLRIVCVERTSGKILWNNEYFKQTPKRKEARNSYATPTPVTDGNRVYAVFADGSFIAVDFDGKVIWTNRSFKYYSQHGLAVSPILYKDLLILPFDHSSEGDNKRLGWQLPWEESFVLCLDKNTGNLRWKAMRGLSRIGHVTPLVVRSGARDILVSGAGDVVQAFDLADGKCIWRIYSQGEGVVPSIVSGDGLIFATSGFEKPTIRAIRLGGIGDVTKTHIAWEQTRGVPMVPSMLYVKPYLYSITDNGIATCFKADTGEIVWQERIGGNHASSPVYADGKIYFLSMEGETTVIEAGSVFKVLAKNPLNEKCQASMAISGKNIFIRTEKNLYCIGRK